MRFRKNVSAEHRELLLEQLKQYKKEMKLTKAEIQELEKWVANGRSPYDNGDYICGEDGYPLDFISAMRVEQEMIDWFMGLSEEEREKELKKMKDDYDTVTDTVSIHSFRDNSDLDSDAELPFS